MRIDKEKKRIFKKKNEKKNISGCHLILQEVNEKCISNVYKINISRQEKVLAKLLADI